LRALFPSTQWELVHVNYTNVVVYPAVWFIRKWRALRQRLGIAGSTKRSEDNLPPRWVNQLLRAIFVKLGEVKVPFPFGVSLILVARRRLN
jgi:hypothetical protein